MSTANNPAAVAAVQAPIQQDPDKLGGHPTIGRKRVQADALIDYFSSGLTLKDFFQDFHSVTEDEALAVLAVIKKAIIQGRLTGIELNEMDII
ncbi:MAG: DUF433 domain-containing protein [Blastocatellia bacterium]